MQSLIGKALVKKHIDEETHGAIRAVHGFKKGGIYSKGLSSWSANTPNRNLAENLGSVRNERVENVSLCWLKHQQDFTQYLRQMIGENLSFTKGNSKYSQTFSRL